MNRCRLFLVVCFTLLSSGRAFRLGISLQSRSALAKQQQQQISCSQILHSSSTARRCTVRARDAWLLAATTTEVEQLDSEPPQEEQVDSELPTPKVGDVVRYRGKWADDIALGEIRGLQYIAPRQKWIADVLPLKEVGSQQYARQRGWGTSVQDVDTLRPVRAFYVRSVNAFQVRIRGDDPKDLVYIGERYDLSNFALPPPPPVNEAAAEVSLAEYEALKARMLSDTLLFGATGSAAAALFAGPEQGAVFALGAAAAVAYVALLGRNADRIGTGGDATTAAGQSRGSKALDGTRLALPIALVAVLAAVQYVRHPGDIQFLRLVPREQFGAAMLGFLGSYRLPLLYRELTRAVGDGGELLADALPGSLAQGSKLLRKLNADKQAAAADAATSGGYRGSAVVVVSGPRGLGREALVTRLIEGEKGAVREPVWCTSRPQRAGERDGIDYHFITPMKFEEEKARSGGYVSVREGPDGELYGLRPQELALQDANGAVTVVNADVDLVRQLIALQDTALIGVWVSLDSLPAIEARLKQTLQSEQQQQQQQQQQNTNNINSNSSDDSDTPLSAEALLDRRVNQALEDIEFGVTSGVFEFTIIDAEAPGSLAKLRKAVEYAR